MCSIENVLHAFVQNKAINLCHKSEQTVNRLAVVVCDVASWQAKCSNCYSERARAHGISDISSWMYDRLTATPNTFRFAKVHKIFPNVMGMACFGCQSQFLGPNGPSECLNWTHKHLSWKLLRNFVDSRWMIEMRAIWIIQIETLTEKQTHHKHCTVHCTWLTFERSSTF